MFKERVQFHEPFVSSHGPEIIRAQHGDGGQHAETACAQPHEPSGYHEQRTTKFDCYRQRRPEPAGMKPEMLLFGDGRREVRQFRDAADDER